MIPKKIQELLDECIGDPKSMRELFEYLINCDLALVESVDSQKPKFNKLLNFLGAKGILTENDKTTIKTTTTFH